MKKARLKRAFFELVSRGAYFCVITQAASFLASSALT